MLTFFSSPKPFRDHIGVIQRNAIHSWSCLKPKPEIILFGDDAGTAEVSEQLGLKHVPVVARNEFGRPLIGDLFEQARRLANNDWLCYINADLILLEDFLRAVAKVQAWNSRCVVSATRIDLDVKTPIDFETAEWAQAFRERAIREGKPLLTGVDLLVFPKGVFDAVPPFALGRPGYDNWLVWNARQRRIPVVNITPSVNIIHQNHSSPADWAERSTGIEARRNLVLMNYWQQSFTLADATHCLRANGVKRAPFTSAKQRVQVLRNMLTLRTREMFRPLVRSFRRGVAS
jgi:hypothetical protein